MSENYKNESMVDVAYSIVKESANPVSFQNLFKQVVAKLELSPEEANSKIAVFYTNLSLDGRFVDLQDNEWDLRERQTYDKVHIDINEIYSDIEQEVNANTDDEELDESEKAEMGIATDADDEENDDEESSSKEDM